MWLTWFFVIFPNEILVERTEPGETENKRGQFSDADSS